MDIKASLVLKDGEIFLAEGFTLLEAMSANELFDKKVDGKLGLQEADTPAKLLSEGKIKPAGGLSAEETLAMIDLMINKWMLYLNGNALAQTVYTLVYQYDTTLWDSSIINGAYQALNTVGNQIFNMVKESPFMKEEDYNPSIFSFRTQRLTMTELLQLLTTVEAEIQTKLKKGKNLTVYDGLSARIKLIKGFAQLVQSLAITYNPEQHKLITQHIDFLRKRLEIVLQTKNQVNLQSYTSDNIFKHIKAVISNRKVPIMADHYAYFAKMLDQIEDVLTLPQERNFFAIQAKVQNIIQKYPKNTLVRAYLESNIFKYDTIQYFHYEDWLSVIMNTLQLMYPQVKFDAIKQEKEFQDYLLPITYDYVTKQLRAPFRQMRDFHKLYQLISMLVHQSNQLDQQYFKPRNPLMIFSYDMALQMMIRQLQLGFELELYSTMDYSFIYFYFSHLCGILDKNRTNHFHQLPQQQQNQMESQVKRKAAPILDNVYNELTYWRGLGLMTKGLAILFHALIQNGNLQQAPNIEHRYSNRLKIFENCYYVKPIKYEEYDQQMKSHGDLTATLAVVSQNLLEAQQQFQEMKQLKQLSPVLEEQAKQLTKICVITSVNTMKLKLKPQSQVKVSQTEIPFVVQFEIV